MQNTNTKKLFRTVWHFKNCPIEIKNSIKKRTGVWWIPYNVEVTEELVDYEPDPYDNSEENLYGL